jgi:hypothetical protein
VQVQQRRLDFYPSRPQLGTVCEYCLLRNRGLSIRFTDFKHYQEHIIKSHPGYSVYAYDEDLYRFQKTLPFEGSYIKKLKYRIKQQLLDQPVKTMNRLQSKSIQSANITRQRKIDYQQKERIISERMNQHKH